MVPELGQYYFREKRFRNVAYPVIGQKKFNGAASWLMVHLLL